MIYLKPKQALQKYLMCSYEYYMNYTSLISDSEYDEIAKYLLSTYEEWKDHQHAYLITKDDLKAGTLFTVKYEDYPEMIKQAATKWAREHFYETEVKQ